MKQGKIVIVMLMLLMLLVGCVSPTVGEAQVEFCQALFGYRDAVSELQDIDAQTTVAEFNDTRANVAQSREELLDSATALRSARLRYTEDAFKNLEQELAGISGETTLGEAADMARIEISVLLTEIDRVYNTSCGRR